jgi:hypothetical protein
MQNKIADIIKDQCKEGKEENYMDAADAIVDALPGMVQPLVWAGDRDRRGFTAQSVLGQYGAFDEGSPRWYSPTRYGITYRHTDTFEQAKAAANAHHAAQVMTAFGVVL